MSYVLSSETGTIVYRVMRLQEHEDGLYVVFGWKVLENSEDTLEPLLKVNEDVPIMLERFLNRKNTPPRLAVKAWSILAL